MLLYPSHDYLLEKIDSKYSLVILASKRAHEIKAFEDRAKELNLNLVNDYPYRSVSYIGKALEEIANEDVIVNPESIDSNLHL